MKLTKRPSKSKSGSASPPDATTPLMASDATERRYQTLEQIWNEIGYRYPNFSATVIPVAVISFANFLISSWIGLMSMSYHNGHSARARTTSVYANCSSSTVDNNQQGAFNAKSNVLYAPVPPWDLPIALTWLFTVFTTLVSRRTQLLIAMTTGIFSMASMRYAGASTQLLHLVAQSSAITSRIVITVICIENVPYNARVLSVCLVELANMTANLLVYVVMYICVQFHIDVFLIYELIALFLCCCLILVTLYVRHSLYWLLAMTKTDELQMELSEIFEQANINLAAEAVVDSVAFEEFEAHDSNLDNIWRAISNYSVLKEVLVVGIFAGCAAGLSEFSERELRTTLNFEMFDFGLVVPFAYWATFLITNFAVLAAPSRRMCPLIIFVPLITLSVCLLFIIGDVRNSTKLNLCTFGTLRIGISKWLTLLFTLLVAILADSSRILSVVHMLEFVPALVRVPAMSTVYALRFLFNGSIRYSPFGKTGNNLETPVFCAMLALVLFLFNPCKSSMHTFFADLDKSWTMQRRSRKLKPLLPAPESVASRE